MPVTAEFDRDLVAHREGAFLTFGLGSDIDGAFDDAILADRFDLGASSEVPSAAALDPACAKTEFSGPSHPHAALTRSLALLDSAQSGEVFASAVSPLREFAHRSVPVVLTDPSLALPDGPGPLWRFPHVLELAAAYVDLADGEEVVSGVIPRAWSERFKAYSVPAVGARRSRFAVVASGSWEPLGLFDSAAAAKKFALGLARAKGAGPGSWEVLPVAFRAEGSEFTQVVRERVACRVPVKVLVARRKDVAKVSTQGWLFSGIVPPTTSN